MELRTPSVRPSDRVALSPSPSRPSPVPRAGGRPVAASAAALALGLAALLPVAPAAAAPGGTVVAWGYDGDGQASVPDGLTDVVAVSAGHMHSLALRADGTVVAWGYHTTGQDAPPADLDDAVSVAAGAYHSAALRSDGTVATWGTLEWGGPGADGLIDVVAIDAGANHGLALRADGTVGLWGGDSQQGQMVVPAGLDEVTAVSAGGSHSLALLADGTVVAFGSDSRGQSTVPDGLTDVVAVSAGSGHSLALRADGTVVGWGASYDGQADVPAGLTDVVAVEAGLHHSVALRADGTVVAWGEAGPQETPPDDLTGVTAISAGGLHTLALVGAPDAVPVLTVPDGVAATATSTDGAAVHYDGVVAWDEEAGSLEPVCTPASGNVLPVGTTTVMCTATDPAGNSTSASSSVSVTYEWSGLRAPVEDDAVLRAGRTVPVRFTLTGASADVRGLDATLSHARVEDGVRGEVVAAVPVRGHHADGNTFREHPRSPRWTFLWSTKGLAPGDYVLLVDLGDGVERAVRITLD